MLCLYNKKMNTFIIMLLVFILLINSFIFSVQTADAFAPAVLIPATIAADDVVAVAAALLVACGFQFSDEWTARLVGNAFIECCPNSLSFLKDIVKLFDTATLDYVRISLLDFSLIDSIRSFLLQNYDTATRSVTVYNPAFVDSSTVLGRFTGSSILYDTDLTTVNERRDLSNYTQITADLYLRVVDDGFSRALVYVAWVNSSGTVSFKRFQYVTTNVKNEVAFQRSQEASDLLEIANSEYTFVITPVYYTDWVYEEIGDNSANVGYSTELSDFTGLNEIHYKITYYDSEFDEYFSFPFTQIVSGISSANSNYIWTDYPASGTHKDEPISVTVPADVTYFPLGANGADLFPQVGTSSKPLDYDIPISIPTSIGGVVDFPLSDSRPFDVGIDISGEYDTTATLTQDVVSDGTSTTTSFIFNIPILGDILWWIVRIATLVGDIFNLLFDYDLWNTLTNIISAVGEGADNIISGVKEGVSSIADSISGAVSATLEGIKTLVIPADFTWDYFINELVAIVSPPQSIDFRSYVNTIEIPDISVNYKGSKAVIVNNSMLRDNISTFRSYIGAFLSVLLVIYNYNMFMKLMGYNGLSFGNSRTGGKKGDD